MNTPGYDELYQRAYARKGGGAEVEALLPSSASKQYFRTLGSDRHLAEFTRKVFQSGFIWRIVNNKRLKRVFNIDIETCGRCSGSLKVIARIEDQDIIDRILAHLREMKVTWTLMCKPMVCVLPTFILTGGFLKR